MSRSRISGRRVCSCPTSPTRQLRVTTLAELLPWMTLPASPSSRLRWAQQMQGTSSVMQTAPLGTARGMDCMASPSVLCLVPCFQSVIKSCGAQIISSMCLFSCWQKTNTISLICAHVERQVVCGLQTPGDALTNCRPSALCAPGRAPDHLLLSLK